ncbi:hypothetical protein C8R47DRAFT_1265109 [Mycena vitilis]|nr:hypothetical protein C8R47DRAFT_1265109 [Mycena vitilis]
MNLTLDIWLYILSLLPIKDAVSVTLVSRELQSMTLEKTLWLRLLQTARTTKPLPCPDDDDLSERKTSDLKRLILHALRLERNWASSTPEIFGPIKKVSIQAHRIIHCIPGTPLLVVHSEDDGRVTCYNVDDELATPPSVYIGRSVFHFSLAFGYDKTYSIACVVTDDLEEHYVNLTSYLVVLTIQTSSLSPTIAISFRRELERGYKFSHLFINTQIVGLLRVHDMQLLEIVAFSRTTRASRVIHTDTAYDETRLCSFLDHSLYVVKHRSHASSNVYICPSSLLPYEDSTEGEIHLREKLQWDDHGIRSWGALDATYSGQEIWFEVVDALTARPVRGGSALTTIHYLNVDEEPIPRTINIRFWSFAETEDCDHDIPVSRRLFPAHSMMITSVNIVASAFSLGRPRNLIDNSDVSVLLLVSDDDNPDSLCLILVQFDPSTFSSTSHRLEMPVDLDLTIIADIALDDHRGKVMLLDTNGFLHIASYA